MASAWIADYPDPDNFLRIGFGAYEKEWIGWHNKDFESLLERANQNQEQVERMAFYQVADKILIEQAVVKPISYGRGHRLVKPWVKNPLSLMKIIYKDVIIDPGEKQGQTQHQVYYPAVSPMPATEIPTIHTFRLDIFQFPSTLDPGFTTDIFSSQIIENLFSGLVQTSPEMDILPDSAQSWEIFQGGRQYVFHLRPDLRWSDGRPVTAGDFEYAWKRVLDPANQLPNAELLYDLRGARAYHLGETSDPRQVGVEAIDPHTLVVDLEGPAGYFLSLLSQPNAFPVPRQALEDFGQDWTEVENLVNNGPFLLEDWQPGESLSLVRNPRYHSSFSGNVHRVELTNVYEMEELDRIALYEDDQLDALIVPGSFIKNISHLQSRYPGEYINVPSLMTTYLVFNTNHAPLNDLRVRQALVMALDVAEWVQVVTGDVSRPAMGGLIPPSLPGHSPEISLPYDLDRARRLMAEAGFPGGFGDLRIWSLFKGSMPSLLEYLKSHWLESLGVEMIWELVPFQSLPRLQKEKPDLLATAWLPDYPDPDNYLRIGFGASDQEWSGWQNEAFESLMEQATKSQDQAERMTLYQAAEKILIEQAVVKPMIYGRTHRLVKPWVKNPLSLMALDQYYKHVIIEPH
jgi:oligopeptide transport system substrate-binding protein